MDGRTCEEELALVQNMYDELFSSYHRDVDDLKAQLEKCQENNKQAIDALRRVGDDDDPLDGYAGAGDFARSELRNLGEK